MATYTKTPNDLFTAVPTMSEPELKITLALIRATYGYHRDNCTMTYDDLHRETGIKGRASIAKGIKEVNGRGFFKKVSKSGYQVVCNSSNNELIKSPLVHNMNSNSSNNELTTSYPKERSKESIYIHYEDNFLLMEMRAAVSAISRETFAVGINDDVFDNLANSLLKLGATPADVVKFGEWWSLWQPVKENRGRDYLGPSWAYHGRPALTTILSQWTTYQEALTPTPRPIAQIAQLDPDDLITADNQWLPG